jgi:HEAT repeat protein
MRFMKDPARLQAATHRNLRLFFLAILLFPSAIHPYAAPTKKGEVAKKENPQKRQESLERLLNMIRFDASTERRSAIQRVIELKDAGERARFIEPLKEFSVSDSDYFVREACIRALAEMKIKAAEDIFIKALEDEKEDVQRAAISGLSAIDSTRGEPIFELIKKEDLHLYSRLTAASVRLLGKMNDPRAVAYLKEKYEDPELHEENRGVMLLYFGAVRALEMREKLLEIAGDENASITLRTYAVNSLGKLGDPASIEPLKRLYDSIRVLKNKQERARYSRLKIQLISSLLRLGDSSAEGEILAAARDDDPNIRLAAIRQIGDLRIAAAEGLLEYKAKFDASTQVKKAAAKALERLHGNASGEDEEEATTQGGERQNEE